MPKAAQRLANRRLGGPGQVIIGALVLSEMENDEKLRRFIARLIQRKARESDKQKLADLMQYAEIQQA